AWRSSSAAPSTACRCSGCAWATRPSGSSTGGRSRTPPSSCTARPPRWTTTAPASSPACPRRSPPPGTTPSPSTPRPCPRSSPSRRRRPVASSWACSTASCRSTACSSTPSRCSPSTVTGCWRTGWPSPGTPRRRPAARAWPRSSAPDATPGTPAPPTPRRVRTNGHAEPRTGAVRDRLCVLAEEGWRSASVAATLAAAEVAVAGTVGGRLLVARLVRRRLLLVTRRGLLGGGLRRRRLGLGRLDGDDELDGAQARHRAGAVLVQDRPGVEVAGGLLRLGDGEVELAQGLGGGLDRLPGEVGDLDVAGGDVEDDLGVR